MLCTQQISDFHKYIRHTTWVCIFKLGFRIQWRKAPYIEYEIALSIYLSSVSTNLSLSYVLNTTIKLSMNPLSNTSILRCVATKKLKELKTTQCYSSCMNRQLINLLKNSNITVLINIQEWGNSKLWVLYTSFTTFAPLLLSS